jgi:hypothetical protein
METVITHIRNAEEAMSDFLGREGKTVRAEELGLDERIGKVVVVGTIYTDGAIVAVSESKARALNYYGGFEYIDPADVTTVGRYTIYSSDSSRVEAAFAALESE